MKKHKKKYTEKEINEILDLLNKDYPEAGCALNYNANFELLAAVILSAQTTDKSVNGVTPRLFEKYPDAYALSKAERKDVEDILKTIGLYKNKAKYIIAMAGMITDKYEGVVPGSYEELIKLPGVGRKTANVILAELFGKQKIAVDTHVFRVSNRIGIINEKDVLHTEKSLMKVLPEDRWTQAHHLFIFHGRNCCHARNPKCRQCSVNEYCRYENKN